MTFDFHISAFMALLPAATMIAGAKVVFWICALAVIFAYVGYPAIIWMLSAMFGRNASPSEVPSEQLPSVTLLIAALNEESVIEQRIQNALKMDYPPDRYEIVIASDGSTDRTAEIARSYSSQGVRLIEFQQRRGKATALNSVIKELRSEIIVLSDANTHTAADAAKQLVRWFKDPKIGAVCGKLVLTDPATGGNVDSVYWRYETLLKRCEGPLGALLGSNGAIYAIRRDVYTPIPEDTIVDDFVIPLLAKQRTNCSIIYDPEAVAFEEAAPSIASEFQRRARIGAGGFQAIILLKRLLLPWNGWVALTFFSHKILRWFCPMFMLGALMCSALLSQQGFYRIALIVQLAFYGASALTLWLPPDRRPKILSIVFMFTSMNLALLVGFVRWCRGGQSVAWKRTERSLDLTGNV